VRALLRGDIADGIDTMSVDAPAQRPALEGAVDLV
jgi:hypothetical protein